MIDPFDKALSDFIDTLPEDHEAARQLLEEAAPFGGTGDLPELAELATMMRSAEPYEPRAEWMAAAKERLMAAPVLPPEKRGFTWLGSMFLPLTQLSFPSLPKLAMPTPVYARALVAAALIVTLASMARSGGKVQNPLLQVTGDQVPTSEAQQAISQVEQQLVGWGSQGSPRDIVLLSKQLEFADDAIDKAPAADQPTLRSRLQGVVRAVRFDGTLEGINGGTLLVSGVAIQVDPALTKQLRIGQTVSLEVNVGGNGKLQATQIASTAPPPNIGTATQAGQESAPTHSSTNTNPAVGAPPAAGSSLSVTDAKGDSKETQVQAFKPAKDVGDSDDAKPLKSSDSERGSTLAKITTRDDAKVNDGGKSKDAGDDVLAAGPKALAAKASVVTPDSDTPSQSSSKGKADDAPAKTSAPQSAVPAAVPNGPAPSISGKVDPPAPAKTDSAPAPAKNDAAPAPKKDDPAPAASGKKSDPPAAAPAKNDPPAPPAPKKDESPKKDDSSAKKK